MHWTDRAEKTGRLVLWLSLASAVVLVPIVYIRHQSQESRAAEAARNAAELARQEEHRKPKVERLAFQSMGSAMNSLSESAATGRVWFSNVSARSGMVCIHGIVENPVTSRTTESLPTCRQVEPYDSNIEMAVMFAGSELGAVCKNAACTLSFSDVPDATASQK